MIELTPESKFEFEGIAVAFKRLAIVNPDVLNAKFIADNRLVLNDACLLIINKMRNKVKNKILALDKYRKEKEHERRNTVYYNSSDGYHEHYRNFGARRTSDLLYGVLTILYKGEENFFLLNSN